MEGVLQMSTTPRTDAFEIKAARDAMLNGIAWRPMVFARTIETELAAEREKVRVLREALEDLRDEQNGAPLCTREIQWKEAMDKADAALDATKEAIK